MGSPEPIDLLHRGLPQLIGSYLLDTPEGPALYDCGPASALDVLEAGVRARGLELGDVRHLLLSHIHLDHAGAAGALVRRHPHLQVHVSEIGLPHVVDPSRLETSARRLYGDAFDELWGELVPVPAANVHAVGDRVLGLDAFPTPGHAAHHVSYLLPDGTLLSGDSAGVRVAPGRFVLPPLPPPEVDLEAWARTIDEIERRAPARLALVHFGVFADVERHLSAFRETLARWSERVAGGIDEEAFVAAAREDVAAADPGLEELYDRAAPFWHGYRGLERYWRKRREAGAA